MRSFFRSRSRYALLAVFACLCVTALSIGQTNQGLDLTQNQDKEHLFPPPAKPNSWGLDLDKTVDRLLAGARDVAVPVEAKLVRVEAGVDVLCKVVYWLAYGLVVLYLIAGLMGIGVVVAINRANESARISAEALDKVTKLLELMATRGMKSLLLTGAMLLGWGAFAQAQVSPPPNGPQVDYPKHEWMKNIGSQKDGSGMCVFTSIEMSAIWCGLEDFRGFRNWCAKNYPGGGYPGKVDTLIAAYCESRSIQKPPYLQYEGGSLDVLKASLGSGRMAAVTLYRSNRYGPSVIYHMVNCIHADNEKGGLMDNNVMGQDSIPPTEWNTIQGLEQQVKLQGKVWIFVWLRHGPPPPPTNRD
jgi:hypothetical protein